MRALPVAAMALCVPSLAAGGEPSLAVKSSTELLAEGFRPIADGDLLDETTVVYVDRMFIGNYWPHDDEDHASRVVVTVDSFVRLKLNSEEFVCILAKTDQCYRANFELGGR